MHISKAIPACLISIIVACSCAARAQVPEKFTNLQVLPTNISRDDLVSMMRGFSFSLDVRCEYCHVRKTGTALSSMDFASDEKKEKITARAMIRMTQEINRNYISKLSQIPDAVECVTCHRRSPHPRTLQEVLSREIDQNGITSAVALYRQLRKEDYGNGKYDFSETSLNLLSESLLKNKKAKESAAVMELNAEANNPLSNWGLACLALAHQANSETVKAEADFTKILELDPQNSWAADELKSIRAARQTH